MKIYILPIIALLLVITSCQNEINQDEPSNDENKSLGQTEELLSLKEVKPVPTEATENRNWLIYEGFIGLYEQHVVVSLSLSDDNTVTGTYFYDKHQKHLNLNGSYDPKSGNYNLTESYKNKQTGLLQFKNFNGELIGLWKKGSKDTEPQEIKLKLLYAAGNTQPKIEFSKYEMKHEITLYNGQTEDIEKVTDQLNVATINKEFKSFSYSITRRNGHMGSADGIIRMDKNSAKQVGHFYGESNCDLAFTFTDKSVDIEENDCEYYHGANAYMDGSLSKVK